MWTMPPPTISVEKVLAECISNITPEERRANFSATAGILKAAEGAYIIAAGNNSLCQIQRVDAVGNMTREEMKWLYDSKMAAAGAPGRTIYDSIKLSAENGRCPLCGRGVVFTLDHNLPKASYPDLTITPANLIPACQDCNKAKTQAFPAIQSEETLHPYFDNVDGEIWLRARVVEVAPAVLFFFVDPPQAWPLTLRDRVRNHFRTFKLRKTFGTEGAGLISDMRGYIIANLSAGGSGVIREYLADMAASCRRVHRNSWKAAALTAMAASDWFCNGGYALLG